MTSVLVATIADNWLNYVFGSAVLAGLFIFIALMAIVYFMGLGVIGSIIIAVPTLFLLSYLGLFPINVMPMAEIFLGLVIAFALLKMSGR
jgi:hypothetical protein